MAVVELKDWELVRALRRQGLKDTVDPSTSRYLNMAADRLEKLLIRPHKGAGHGKR